MTTTPEPSENDDEWFFEFTERMQRVKRSMRNNTSPLELLLRGHLWIEREMGMAIHAVLPFPEQLEPNGRHLSFALRLRLAAAHGLILPAEVGGYRALNSLRNEVAHAPESDVTPDGVRDLVNSLGPLTRYFYNGMVAEEELASDDWLGSLRIVLGVLLSLIASHSLLRGAGAPSPEDLDLLTQWTAGRQARENP